MERIGETLARMALASEDELGRLLAEARASTRQRQGIAAGMSGRNTHPRAKRHDREGARPAQDETGKDAGSTKPPASQGGVCVTTNLNGGSRKFRFAYRVIVNPAMPTMDMDRGVALPHVRKAPRTATPRPMFIVISGGRH